MLKTNFIFDYHISLEKLIFLLNNIIIFFIFKIIKFKFIMSQIELKTNN